MEKKKPNCPEIDRQLIERFASGNGTVFVGAGISMRSKLPSWAQLIEPLRDELGALVSPSASHLDVAEQYEAAHGRSAMVRYLKRALGDVRYQSSHAHDLIVSLPVQRIYTTNFDDLLERAAHKKGINRHVIHLDPVDREAAWRPGRPRLAGHQCERLLRLLHQESRSGRPVEGRAADPYCSVSGL